VTASFARIVLIFNPQSNGDGLTHTGARRHHSRRPGHRRLIDIIGPSAP
jgi:hypothetical protein